MQTIQRRKKTAAADRLAKEARLDQVVKPSLDYIFSPVFDDPAMEPEILGPMPGEAEFQEKRRKMRAPQDVPAELASLYEWPLLTKEQEQHVFRKMNFLKHRLHRLGDISATGHAAQADALRAQIKEVRDRLINCNMRLVVVYAKKRANAPGDLFELVSDGNVSLMRAVEKFDYSRGNKFSTYASWAIMKNFARSIPDEKRYRERHVTGHEEMFEAQADDRSGELEVATHDRRVRDCVNELLDQLDPRARDIVRMRNGLAGHESMTLEQIGQHFGITKERVRQINLSAMKRLRDSGVAAKFDVD